MPKRKLLASNNKKSNSSNNKYKYKYKCSNQYKYNNNLSSKSIWRIQQKFVRRRNAKQRENNGGIRNFLPTRRQQNASDEKTDQCWIRKPRPRNGAAWIPNTS